MKAVRILLTHGLGCVENNIQELTRLSRSPEINKLNMDDDDDDGTLNEDETTGEGCGLFIK